MSMFKEKFIIDFLLSRGWEIEREGKLFIYLFKAKYSLGVS